MWVESDPFQQLRLVSLGMTRSPVAGRLKLNVDASISTSKHRAGVGWALRDHIVKLAGCRAIAGCREVKVLEAMAVIEGLKAVIATWPDGSGRQIEVESDCLEVYLLLNDSKVDLTEVTHSIGEALALKSAARVISFLQTNRGWNQMAHLLVLKVMAGEVSIWWEDLVPTGVISFLSFGCP